MSGKTIIDGNKLIADFMKLKKESELYKRKEVYIVEGVLNNGSFCHFSNELKYHSSYDWLMPVVEKIIGLGFQFSAGDGYVQLYLIGVSKTGCSFPLKKANYRGTEGKLSYVYFTAENRLQATFKIVVEAIKQYNSKTKKVKK